MNKEFFPKRPEASPTIYAYEDTNPQYDGLLKVGYTSAQSAEERVAQQYPTKRPGKTPYKIVLIETAMREDGSSFTDHDVHRLLRARGFLNPTGEWFKCSKRDIVAAIVSVRERKDFDLPRTQTFGMRPEQAAAVEKTIAYFKSYTKEDPKKAPHFLWNAKMRFGKTFTAYQLAKKMGWTKVLVLTFKPAVQNAWKEDLESHTDFDGWRFVDCKDSDSSDGFQPLKNQSLQRQDAVATIDAVATVAFGSFQDLLGKNKVGGIKSKNEWVHSTNWDCVILDPTREAQL